MEALHQSHQGIWLCLCRASPSYLQGWSYLLLRGLCPCLPKENHHQFRSRVREGTYRAYMALFISQGWEMYAPLQFRPSWALKCPQIRHYSPTPGKPNPKSKPEMPVMPPNKPSIEELRVRWYNLSSPKKSGLKTAYFGFSQIGVRGKVTPPEELRLRSDNLYFLIPTTIYRKNEDFFGISNPNPYICNVVSKAIYIFIC